MRSHSKLANRLLGLVEAEASPTVVTDKNTTEIEPHKVVAEASELGIQPGVTPAQLKTTLGNRQPFFLVTQEVNGTLHYQQAHGILELVVLND